MGKVKLTDICSPKQWKTIPTEQLTEDGYPVYGANGIIGKYSEYNHANPVIAITCRGATCGNINITQEKAYVTGNAMCLDDLCSDVDLEYLFYALRHYDFSTVISGSAQPQITRQGLSKVSIQLFPFDQQKFIAKTLAKAERIISHRRTQLAKLDELVKCRFVELFGDPVTNTKQYEIGPLESIASYWNGLTYSPDDVTDEGTVVLRSSNIQNSVLDFKDTVRVNCRITNKKYVQENDILMCSRNGSAKLVGKVALIQGLKEPMAFGAFMMIIRSPLYYPYLLTYFQMPAFRLQIATAATTTINQITGNMLDKIKLPIPPVSEVEVFATFVHRIDKLRFVIQQSLDETQKLFDSLMQEYFD